MGSCLTLLVQADLVFNRFPVPFNLVSVLAELVVSFLLTVLLKEAVPVGYDSINMGLVSFRYLKCGIPLVHFNVQLDGSVVQFC